MVFAVYESVVVDTFAVIFGAEIALHIINVGPTGRPTIGTVSLMGIGRSPHIL